VNTSGVLISGETLLYY